MCKNNGTKCTECKGKGFQYVKIKKNEVGKELCPKCNGTGEKE